MSGVGPARRTRLPTLYGISEAMSTDKARGNQHYPTQRAQSPDQPHRVGRTRNGTAVIGSVTVSRATAADVTNRRITDGGDIPALCKEPSTLTALTGFQRDLLIAIQGFEQNCEMPPSGVRLHEHLTERYPETFAKSRVYNNLTTLTKANLINRIAINGRTNGYVTTIHAVQLLEAYCEYFERQLAVVPEEEA